MPLPYYTNTKSSTYFEPIYKSLFSTIAISSNKHFVINAEKFQISDSLISLKIQEDKTYGYSDIVNIKILLLEYFDKKGDIIKFEIFEVKNIGYKSTYDWNESNISIIEAEFNIKVSRVVVGDGISLDSVVKSLLRDFKLDDLLE